MALAVEADGLFQLALADEAPGSNHVGHNIYIETLFVHFLLHPGARLANNPVLRLPFSSNMRLGVQSRHA